MAAGSNDRKLPPILAYPFIATNLLLLITILIDVSHQFQGWLITCLSLIFAVCDFGLAIAVFIWLRRNARRTKFSN
jgi:cytochrome c oxidase subunit IV